MAQPYNITQVDLPGVFAAVQHDKAAETDNQLRQMQVMAATRQVDQENQYSNLMKDPNATWQQAAAISPAYSKQMVEFQGAIQKANNDKLAATWDHTQKVGQLISSATDQPSYDRARMNATQMGLDVSSLPATYDPKVVDQLNKQNMTVAEMLKNEQEQRQSQQKADQFKATHDETMRHNRVMEDQAANGGMALDPSSIDYVAQQYAMTGQLPPLGMGKDAAKMRQQIIDRAAQLAHQAGTTGTDAVQTHIDTASNKAAQIKATRDFATGQQGNQVRSLNVSIAHLDTLGKLGDALNNGDVQLLNKVKNAYTQQFGGEAPTDFNSAKQIVSDEIVKAILNTGGGVSDREEAAKQISSASSPAQLTGVINTYKQLLAGQMHGLRQQYETGTGKKDFESKLRPETLAAMKAVETPKAVQDIPHGAIVTQNGKRYQKNGAGQFVEVQ